MSNLTATPTKDATAEDIAELKQTINRIEAERQNINRRAGASLKECCNIFIQHGAAALLRVLFTTTRALLRAAAPLISNAPLKSSNLIDYLHALRRLHACVPTDRTRYSTGAYSLKSNSCELAQMSLVISFTSSFWTPPFTALFGDCADSGGGDSNFVRFNGGSGDCDSR